MDDYMADLEDERQWFKKKMYEFQDELIKKMDCFSDNPIMRDKFIELLIDAKYNEFDNASFFIEKFNLDLIHEAAWREELDLFTRLYKKQIEDGLDYE